MGHVNIHKYIIMHYYALLFAIIIVVVIVVIIIIRILLLFSYISCIYITLHIMKIQMNITKQAHSKTMDRNNGCFLDELS